MRPTLPRQFLRISTHVTPLVQHQIPIRTAYYRGGTSRAAILQPRDLPAQQTKWPSIFRQVLKSFGQGEHQPSQGRASLGKICLVEPYPKGEEVGHPVPDIDYTFVSLDFTEDSSYVDVSSYSGNMLSAVGPYAYNSNLLPKKFYGIANGEVTVLIRNTNTMKLTQSTFTVVGGQAVPRGNHTVDGVDEKGSVISVVFLEPFRSATSKTFPTSRTVDEIEGYKVSCVDGATPVVLVRADAIGVPGHILPHELSNDTTKLDLLERIRTTAAVKMGIAETEQNVPRTVPQIALVAQSSSHDTVSTSGRMLKASQMDIVVRFITNQEPHYSIPLTGALTTALAARSPSSIAAQLLAPEQAVEGALTVAHPSGIVHVRLSHQTFMGKPMMLAGRIDTTAQRLLKGTAYWTDDSQETDTSTTTHDTERVPHSQGLAFVKSTRVQGSGDEYLAQFKQPSTKEALQEGGLLETMYLAKKRENSLAAKPGRHPAIIPDARSWLATRLTPRASPAPAPTVTPSWKENEAWHNPSLQPRAPSHPATTPRAVSGKPPVPSSPRGKPLRPIYHRIKGAANKRTESDEFSESLARRFQDIKELRKPVREQQKLDPRRKLPKTRDPMTQAVNRRLNSLSGTGKVMLKGEERDRLLQMKRGAVDSSELGTGQSRPSPKDGLRSRTSVRGLKWSRRQPEKWR